VGNFTNPNFKLDVTLAIVALSGKTPSRMHSFITLESYGARKHFDKFFKACTGISSNQPEFVESNPLIRMSISSGLVL